MFKLSKESKITFYALMVVPCLWIALNSYGVLDGWKVWTLDQRMTWNPFGLFRGEVSHREASNADDPVRVDENQTVPRVPQVMYVNFDAKTLEMEGVGERPWDRAFFRDVAKVLLERGNARVVAFDFLFSPKSASRMVPEDNVYRSDGAVGELVAAYPDRVVLGSGYTGVQTMLMKVPDVSANPPVFIEGFDESMIEGKYPYPEAPTYPMQNFVDGEYLGRIGSITVIPYRAVDNVPRWVPLWFPGGGKAHAYNVLGGKREKLALDLLKGSSAEISEIQTFLANLKTKREAVQQDLASSGGLLASLSEGKNTLEQKISKLQAELAMALKGNAVSDSNNSRVPLGEVEKVEAKIGELDEVIGNFQTTLKANPAIAAIVGPQLKARQEERAELISKLADLKKDTPKPSPQDQPDPVALAKLEAQISELDEVIGNFQTTLEANPALAAIVGPQLKAREEERSELISKLAELKKDTPKPSPQDQPEPVALAKLEAQISELDEVIGNFQKTLEANPALAAIVGPQLKAREAERAELAAQLSESTSGDNNTNGERTVGFVVDDKRAAEIRSTISQTAEELSSLTLKLTDAAKGLAENQATLEAIQGEFSQKEKNLLFLQGGFETELIESDGRLRLVSKHPDEEGNGSLVESLPNEMPLNYERNYYTLGLEALLAYYGLDHDAVNVSNDGKRLVISSRDGEELVNAPMNEKQFVEVNWFSRWSARIPEVVGLREARKLYGGKRYQEYVALVPEIIRGFISRIKDVDAPSDVEKLPQVLSEIGVSDAHVAVASELVKAASGESPAEDAPSFDELLDLTVAIEYYFLPVTLESPHNPMCGMKDVLDFDGYLTQRTADLANIDGMLFKIRDEFIPKLESVLKENPEHPQALAKMEEVKVALATNEGEREKVLKELELLNAFFTKFDKAIVFIGPEEKTFQDLAPTPFDSIDVPKVGVHGNLVKTLTSGLYLKRLPEWVDHLVTLGFCLAMAFISVYSGPKASLVQVGGLFLQVGYVLLAFFMFSETHILWPVVTPACAGLSTTFVGLGVMLIVEQKAKGRLKGMFGSYVSSDLVDQMVESGKEPSLGGEETQITAFFSDVQAFSSFSELLGPTGLVDLMNEYLTAMTNILQEERGTLDKYIGDAIVGMYGAPIPMDDHAYQSVRTALLMQARQLELREKWSKEEDKWGACHQLVSRMQTRIGCNTGTATVGNMGALDRFNYTMMGDMVNLAARCESGAKAYGAYIMITKETKDAAIPTKDDIAYRYLDKIVVKGRTQPVAMYEPTGFKNDLTQETQDCLDCFQQGIDKFLLQDWNGALNMFEKAKGFEPNKPGVTPGVKDNPSMILIDRCQVMKDNPPGDDWDGVYVMTSK
jgi:class 3 adenylate cyclase/CHASE2 domain-containing sensor protein